MKDLNMIKCLQELSQVLVVSRISISTYGEEHILIVLKNLSTSLEVIEELEFHKPHLQDDQEASTNHPCKFEEAENLWATSDCKHPLESEIEELLTCLSLDIPCTQETNHLNKDNLHGMTEEDLHSGLNKETDQEHHSYIERRFKATIKPHHPSFITSRYHIICNCWFFMLLYTLKFIFQI